MEELSTCARFGLQNGKPELFTSHVENLVLGNIYELNEKSNQRARDALLSVAHQLPAGDRKDESVRLATAAVRRYFSESEMKNLRFLNSDNFRISKNLEILGIKIPSSRRREILICEKLINLDT